VLVQRGRGGGLTGALGGMGGSSAFGAKAGDIFTRITIVTAAIWICVCAASVYWANHRSDRLGSAGVPGSTATQSAPAETGLQAPAASDEKSTSEKNTSDTEGTPDAESGASEAAVPATPATPAPATPQ
jgi:preprotein translocase subunit SecG